MPAGQSALRQVLRDVLERWDRADKAAWQAQAKGGQDVEALAARQIAEAECRALSAELADLLQLLFRCASENKETAASLSQQLIHLLAPDLVKLVMEILTEKARHEAKR